MRSEDSALDLIDGIYAAAEDPSLWKPLLGRLAAVTGATVTGLIFEDTRSKRASVSANTGIDPERVRDYEEHYARVNAWMHAIHWSLPSGTIVTSESMLPDRDLIRSEYYNDFLRKIHAKYALAAGLFQEEGFLSHLSLLRPGRAFDRPAIALLRTLTPHLQRALQLHRRIVDVQFERQALADTLDRLPVGVLVLGPQGRPVLVNSAAREILADRDGLTLHPDGLRAARAFETTLLQNLIRDAATLPSRTSTPSRGGGTLAIARPSLRRPLSLLVTPLRSSESGLPAPSRRVAVFVTDPERRVEASGALLRGLYGFTRAEAGVAEKLLQGESIEQVARELEITLNTARTHLKHLFVKTDTNRHRELVRVLLLNCTNLPRSSGGPAGPPRTDA